MRLLLIVIVLFMTLTAAHAQTLHQTGIQLLKNCEIALSPQRGGTSREGTEAFFMCAAYINGLDDMHSFVRGWSIVRSQRDFAVYCLPQTGVSLEHLMRTVVLFLRANPQRLNEPARVLFVSAMRAAYPCQTSERY